MGISEKTIDRVVFESDGTFKELASPPSNPSASYSRLYRKTDGKWYSINSAGVESPLGSGGSISPVSDTGHGYVTADVGTPLRRSGGKWVKAQADIEANAEVFALLYRVIDVDNFEIITGGEVLEIDSDVFEAVPAVDAEVWLSPLTNGKLTTTEPTTIGQIGKPLGVVTRSSGGTVDIIFNNFRGEVVGGVDAVSPPMALGNSSTTDVANVSTLSAGIIRLTVTVNATTPLIGHYDIIFVKNGAGNYIGSVGGPTGDAAASNIELTNAGILRITLGTNAGFSSANAVYTINSPSTGAKFPIAIGESNIVPDGGAIGQFETITASKTLTLSSPRLGYVSSPAAPINVTLPTGTAIKKGYRYRLEAVGANATNYVALLAGGVIDKIVNNGFVEVMAEVDNPTTAADWRVIGRTPHVVLASISANQTLTSGTPVNFTSINTGYQLSGGDIVVPRTGKYLVVFGTRHNFGTVTGSGYFQVLVDGTEPEVRMLDRLYNLNHGAESIAYNRSAVLSLTAGQLVQLNPIFSGTLNVTTGTQLQLIEVGYND